MPPQANKGGTVCSPGGQRNGRQGLHAQCATRPIGGAQDGSEHEVRFVRREHPRPASPVHWRKRTGGGAITALFPCLAQHLARRC